MIERGCSTISRGNFSFSWDALSLRITGTVAKSVVLIAQLSVSHKHRGSEPAQALLTNVTIFELVNGLAPCCLSVTLV